MAQLTTNEGLVTYPALDVLPRSEKSLNARMAVFGSLVFVIVCVTGPLLLVEFLSLMMQGMSGLSYTIDNWELKASLTGNSILLTTLLGGVARRSWNEKYKYYSHVPQGRVAKLYLSAADDSPRCNVVVEGYNLLNQLRSETYVVTEKKWRSYNVDDIIGIEPK